MRTTLNAALYRPVREGHYANLKTFFNGRFDNEDSAAESGTDC
jgi:hypothetical protein